jgi:hypothetical protein
MVQLLKNWLGVAKLFLPVLDSLIMVKPCTPKARGVKNYWETGIGKLENRKIGNRETGDPIPIPVLKNQKPGIPVPIPGFYWEPVKLYILFYFFRHNHGNCYLCSDVLSVEH